jgi:tetratricopeptide (TPR) repeat protein
VWEERGDILADLERWEEARAKYESAIECVEREGYEAQLPTLLIDRARTYLETGDYADAWRDVHRAEDLGEELELTWLGRILDRVREPLREKMPEPERAGDRADDGSADR